MSFNITQVKTQVGPKLRGTTVNQLQGFYEKCQEAAGNVLSRCYPIETIRKVRIENAIYSHIYNYSFNQDARGNKALIDIKPISLRSRTDDIAARYPREFDIRKDRNTATIEVINGVKTLRLSKRINGHTVLADMDSLTQGATITGTGDVENLTTNTLDYISGSASVQFGLSGSTGTGSIKIALTNTVDLTTAKDIGALFFWMNFATASRLTSVAFRYGSSDSAYWYNTITAPHDRTAFESNAWTLQRADWSSASSSGSPDVTAVDYIELVFTYSAGAAIANNRLDNITISVGQPYEAVYYSDRLFKDTSGNFLSIPTQDSDTVNIAVDGFNIFLYELMLIIIQESGAKSVTQSAKWFQTQLDGYGNVKGLYDNYNSAYPSQVLPAQTTYYNFDIYSNDDED